MFRYFNVIDFIAIIIGIALTTFLLILSYCLYLGLSQESEMAKACLGDSSKCEIYYRR